MKIRASYIIAGILASSSISIASGATYTLEPGKLPELLTLPELAGETTLVLKGSATVSDLTALRNLPASVESLDIRDLVIKGDSLPAPGIYGFTAFRDGELPPYMAYGTGLKIVVLPDNISRIGDYAFSETQLRDVDCHRVDEVGANVFRGCKALKTVDLSGLRKGTIENGTFDGCSSLTGVSLPEVTSRIGDFAFRGTALKSISLPHAVSMGKFAFAETPALTDISFPDWCKMDKGVFYGAGSLIDLGGNPVDIPDLYAYGSLLNKDSVFMGGKVIGAGAYADTDIHMAVITRGVERISDRALAGLKYLNSVDITGLGANVPETAENAFEGTAIENATLYVLTDTESVWKSAPIWKEFKIESRAAGLEEIMTGAEILIQRDVDAIRIQAPGAIESAEIYGMDGRKLCGMSSDSGSLRLPLADAVGVVIVRAKSGGMVKIAKIVL